MLKTYQNKAGKRVAETSVVPLKPIVAIDMVSFISNNTHYTKREIVSPTEVRLSIESTLKDAGVPVDELIPRFTIIQANDIFEAADLKQKFPLVNPEGLHYRKEPNKLVFYFPDDKSSLTISIQFLPGNAPANQAALELVAKTVQVVTEVSSK